MPAEKLKPFSNVAMSFTRSGSKTVTSASAPIRSRPLFFMAGAIGSSRFAGMIVILASACISVSVLFSLNVDAKHSRKGSRTPKGVRPAHMACHQKRS